MERLNSLPRWVAEPWHDAEETDDPVGQTKKWLEVAEAMLERLAMGVVTHALHRAHDLDPKTQKRIRSLLLELKDRRASFGDWVELLAAAVKGPESLRQDVLGTTHVGPFDSRTASAKAAGLVIGRESSQVTLLQFFGRMALARNSFAHGHASAAHCEALSVMLRAALPEVVEAIPALSGQAVCSVGKLHMDAGVIVVEIYPERGTGRPRRALWKTSDPRDVASWSEATHLLWTSPEGKPVQVPRWLIHRNAADRLLPWQGGARGDEAFYYVDRAEAAGAHSQVKLEEPELRRDFIDALDLLGHDATQEMTAVHLAADVDAGEAASAYRAAVSVALCSDGRIDDAERVYLQALAAMSGLDAEAVQALEREAFRSAGISQAPQAVAPVVMPPSPPASDVAHLPARIAEPALPVVDVVLAAPRRRRRRLWALIVLGACAGAVALVYSSGLVADASLTTILGDLPGSASASAVQPALDWVEVPASPGVAGFAVTRTEVTVAQYAACVAAGVCQPPHWDDEQCVMEDRQGRRVKAAIPARVRGDNQPVTCITYADLAGFAVWVGARIPTRAEWQVLGFDAKGRDPSQAQVMDTCGQSIIEDASGSGCGTFGPRDVCSLGRRGSLGLCDVFGNVFEWVAAEGGASQEGAIFGGGWSQDAAYTAVDPHDPTHFRMGTGRFNTAGAGLGFRLAKTR